MVITKDVTTRVLLRNFKEIKKNLISKQVGMYQIEVGDEIIEMRLAKKKKGNVGAILKALDKLPKGLKIERYDLPLYEIFPKREWSKKK